MSNKAINICAELNLVLSNANEMVSNKQKELLNKFIEILHNNDIHLSDDDYLELLDLSKIMVDMNNNGKSILFWINKFMENIEYYID